MKTKNIWKGKKVLVIGNRSFIGSWLTVWLHELGATVIGYSNQEVKDDDNYTLCKLKDKIKEVEASVTDKEAIRKVFKEEQPEIVINMVAFESTDRLEDSSTSNNDIDSETTNINNDMDIRIRKHSNVYEKNVLGTLNVLESIEQYKGTKVCVNVTSQMCYANKNEIWGYKESDKLSGINPFSASVSCSELIIDSYRNTYLNPRDYDKHGCSVASVRMGNVIGGGNWDSEGVISVCAKAFVNKEPAILNCSNIVQPWMHVLEPLRGILMLVEKMYEEPTNYCESFNFGAEYTSCMSTLDAVDKFKKEFKNSEVLELDEGVHAGACGTNILDITKAKFKLGWVPKWTLDKTMTYTAQWYKNYKTKDVYTICRNQIEKYSLL